MPRQLKIDRRFIQLLPDAGTTIATAIISLAHGFNLCVVAEGVENRAQLGWLQRADARAGHQRDADEEANSRGRGDEPGVKRS